MAASGQVKFSVTAIVTQPGDGFRYGESWLASHTAADGQTYTGHGDSQVEALTRLVCMMSTALHRPSGRVTDYTRPDGTNYTSLTGAIARLVAAGAPEDQAQADVNAMAPGALLVSHGVRVARGEGRESKRYFLGDSKHEDPDPDR